jgi:hypothetical protein
MTRGKQKPDYSNHLADCPCSHCSFRRLFKAAMAGELPARSEIVETPPTPPTPPYVRFQPHPRKYATNAERQRAYRERHRKIPGAGTQIVGG